ncbi:hypothetical protein P7C70_g822, partial [Phenoliferia sp. Uapishka_3]
MGPYQAAGQGMVGSLSGDASAMPDFGEQRYSIGSGSPYRGDRPYVPGWIRGGASSASSCATSTYAASMGSYTDGPSPFLPLQADQLPPIPTAANFYEPFPIHPYLSAVALESRQTLESLVEAYGFEDGAASYYGVQDPGKELSEFFGNLPHFPMTPRQASDAPLEEGAEPDSSMDFEDGFDMSASYAAQDDEALCFGAATRGVKYQYQLDPSLPPPESQAFTESYPPSPATSTGSSVYASPYSANPSLPTTTFNSPHPSPHLRMTPLVVSPYTTSEYDVESPLSSPGYTPSMSSAIPFPTAPSRSSAIPFPQPPPLGSRCGSRSQPNSRPPSVSHLPGFSPYLTPVQHPTLHKRHSSTSSAASILHHTSAPNLHASQGSVFRPSAGTIQASHSPLLNGPGDGAVKKSQHRLRQSVSFPSSDANLFPRRSQSYSARGSAGWSRRSSLELEGLSGLGVTVGRRSSATDESRYLEPTEPFSPVSGGLGFNSPHRWPGSIGEVAGVQDSLEGMSLRQNYRTEEMQVDMDRGEGTVMLKKANEALTDSTVKYLEAQDRLMEGERTVLVLAPRVAQRSYGNEKRFLCPQPMSLVLGISWWSNVDDPRIKPESLPYAGAKIRRINLPPEVSISISTDPSPSPDFLNTEWMTKDGGLIDPDWPLDLETHILSGRTTGKSNFVPAGEASKGTDRPVVRPLVTIVAPGTGPKASRLIGTFPGKAMHIISKPSKGKLTESSKTGLAHGDLVSLYNRVKSQTASTRFLGVSGDHSSFPTMDWRAMTGNQPRPYAPPDIQASTFVARTGRWDAFIMYAVDLTLPIVDSGSNSGPFPFPGYPRPPANAIACEPGEEKKIYYNMPIVLQCLSTAVVSPIMILRKVDGGRTAIGGGSLTGYAPETGLPCPPGERLGDAVAQFRPMALEIYTDPSKVPSGERSPTADTFLACLGDTIGINQSRETRKYFNQSGQESDSRPQASMSPNTPGTPGSTSPPFAMVGLPSDYHNLDDAYTVSASGQKVKRVRRVSSNGSLAQTPYTLPPNRPQSTQPKRKRGPSAINLLQLPDSNPADEPSPNVWSIDCGAVEMARHTFFVPPATIGGKFGSGVPPTTCSTLYSTPTPCYPISPQIPILIEYAAPARQAGPEDTGDEEELMLTLHGANFSNAFTVWIGTTPCIRHIYKSAQKLLVSLPTRIPSYRNPSNETVPLRITFVRNDGIVFPTPIFYTEPH